MSDRPGPWFRNRRRNRRKGRCFRPRQCDECERRGSCECCRRTQSQTDDESAAPDPHFHPELGAVHIAITIYTLMCIIHANATTVLTTTHWRWHSRIRPLLVSRVFCRTRSFFTALYASGRVGVSVEIRRETFVLVGITGYLYTHHALKTAARTLTQNE